MVLCNCVRGFGLFVFAIVLCASPCAIAQNNTITVTFLPFNPSGEKVNVAFSSSDTADSTNFLYEIGQEVGIPRARMQLFVARLMLMHKRYADGNAERERNLANLTLENYIEGSEAEFDELLLIFDDVKKTATATLNEAQYGQFVTRIYQFFALGKEHSEKESGNLESQKAMAFRELLLSSLYPIILGLSEQQQQDIADSQKKMFIDLRRIQIDTKEQFAKYKESTTAPEEDTRLDISFRQTTFDRFWSYDDDKVRSGVSQDSMLSVENPRILQAREQLQLLRHIGENIEKSMQELVDNFRTGLEDILTDEQKTHLVQIREDTPEYLREKFRR